jgi:ATP-dependent RNA helicase DeaD
MTSFEDFRLSEPVLSAIKKLGFTTPTVIQQDSIPHIVRGEDVIGESATGSGKTLAFGCGIVERADPGKGVQALVLTPTRELAEQVKQVLAQLSRLKVTAVYGGMSMKPQITAIASAEVVVATPGRLLDHINKRTINLSKINMLVLDEADRMLDMGFIVDVEKIIRTCPRQRQTLFFSATISPSIDKLTKKYMKTPVKVSVENYVDPSKLKQVYYNVTKNGKLSLLVHLMRDPFDLAMVFCNTRRTTDFVARTLKANDVNARAIHGGFEQNKRAKTIAAFNRGDVTVLVCTDVAARGIHIDNVSHVYNYEIPRDPTDYVHRIGRTARAGEKGKVVNFVSERDQEDFAKIMKKYRLFNIKKTTQPTVKKIVPASREKSSGKRGFRRGKPKRTFSRKRRKSRKRR